MNRTFWLNQSQNAALMVLGAVAGYRGHFGVLSLCALLLVFGPAEIVKLGADTWAICRDQRIKDLESEISRLKERMK